jgi:hypothetical protein
MGNETSSFLPRLPDVVGTIQSIGAKHWHLLWCDAPSPAFPDLDSLPGSEGKPRYKYYVVALAVCFACHSVLGVVLTIARNRLAPEAVYVPLGQQKAAEDLTKRLLRGRALIGIVVASWFACYAFALKFVLEKDAISRKQGVVWEAWLIWLNVHCLSGLFEVMVSVCQPGKRRLGTYPAKMAMTLLPFLSEKFDAAKDVVFIGIAFHEDEVVLGYSCFCILVVAQALFVWFPSTRGEIIESYLPCLVVTAEGTDTSGVRLINQDSSPDQNLIEPMQQFLYVSILKQTSEARRRITALEDCPQGVAMIYFAYHHKGSPFVAFTLILSLLRLLVSTLFGRVINRALADPLRRQRTEAARANNAVKVLTISKTLWEAVDENEAVPELKEVGFGVTDLLAEGLTVKQLVNNAGFNETGDAEQILANGSSVK